MNYKLHYNRLIERAKQRKLEDYSERHHIIPRCMGGTDAKDNIVRLTASEHYVAHQLLSKMYPHNHKLVYAMKMMCTKNNLHIRNNKMYSWIRRKVAIAISVNNTGRQVTDEYRKDCSIRNTGKGNPFFGKTHTDEYKATRSALYKGKTAEEIMGAEAAAKRKIKASQTFTKKHSDPEYKLAQSKRMTEWWAKRKEQKKC